jgi:hypothetical protein
MYGGKATVGRDQIALCCSDEVATKGLVLGITLELKPYAKDGRPQKLAAIDVAWDACQLRWQPSSSTCTCSAHLPAWKNVWYTMATDIPLCVGEWRQAGRL